MTPGPGLLHGLRMAARRARRRALRGRSAARLHLGCGADYWPGWVNVDLDPAADSDLCLDVRRVGERFQPGSVAEVAFIHSLGYLSLFDARALLRDLRRLLVARGPLVVEGPDLARCARRLLDAPSGTAEYLEGVRGLYGFGREELAGRGYDAYRFGWSSAHLADELRAAGFDEVVEASPRSHGPLPWRDYRLEARWGA